MIHFAHRKKKNKPIPTTSHHFLIFKYNKNNYKLWLIVKKKIIKRKGKAIQKNNINEINLGINNFNCPLMPFSTCLSDGKYQ